ncbi:MAG: ribonuclease D [Thiogranum sp.]|nr:ribonuclease D [Thiogranum sp.]
MSAPAQAKTEFEFIDTPGALADFCASLKGLEWIALDTEFIREKTYYPRLCLIQIGIPGSIACIDPLAIEDLTPLLDIFYDRSITKVLHACSQDLEIFAYLKGSVPGPIFDTQLAAPLLGFVEQMGYGNFVKEMLGVNLEKGQARTDWARRPLDHAQLYYAADDVRYLAEMYPQMRARLEEQGRLQWLDAEFEPYERAERYLLEPADAWQRLKGLDKLRPKGLAIMQRLAEWRERTAQQKDLPRSWVLKDDFMLDIARMGADSEEKLAKIRNLPPKTLERYGATLIELVKAAMEQQPVPLPAWKKRERATAQEEALADVLHAQLRLLAERYQINCATLAGRKDIVALAQGEEDIPLLRGWRRKMAGEELLAMRDGERDVAIVDRQVLVSAK